jgi:hypothetical protein
MKNYKIANINRNARYTVTPTDHDDGHAETREMTGAELIDFTNAAAHLYDIHAEEITAKPQDTAEIMQQVGAVELPQRVALYVTGTQGTATATDNAAQVERVARDFCGWFGGATAQQSAGYWLSDSAGLVREAVTIVYAACTADQLRDRLPDVLTLAQQIKAEMQQEAVTITIDQKMYII